VAKFEPFIRVLSRATSTQVMISALEDAGFTQVSQRCYKPFTSVEKYNLDWLIPQMPAILIISPAFAMGMTPQLVRDIREKFSGPMICYPDWIPMPVEENLLDMRVAGCNFSIEIGSANPETDLVQLLHKIVPAMERIKRHSIVRKKWKKAA